MLKPLQTPLDLWAETNQISEVLHRRFEPIRRANIKAYLQDMKAPTPALWFWDDDWIYDPLRERHRSYVIALLERSLTR
jgi:hypothetical protein